MTGIVLGPKHLTDSGKLSRPLFPSGIETTSIWLHQGNYDEQIEVEHVAGRRIKSFLKATEILELLWQHNLAYVIHTSLLLYHYILLHLLCLSLLGQVLLSCQKYRVYTVLTYTPLIHSLFHYNLTTALHHTTEGILSKFMCTIQELSQTDLVLDVLLNEPLLLT